MRAEIKQFISYHYTFEPSEVSALEGYKAPALPVCLTELSLPMGLVSGRHWCYDAFFHGYCVSAETGSITFPL